MYAKVIIEYSVKKLDKEFIYMIPEYLKDKLKIGMKVYVSFGNKEVIGFVTDIVSEIDTEDYEIKYITDIVDENLVLNEELMTLGKYLKDRTLCSLITAYQTMLPSSLKVKKNTHNYDLYIEYLKLIDEDKANKYKFNNPRKKRQINLIEELLKNKTVNKKGIIKSVYEPLINEGIISILKEKKYRINKTSDNVNKVLTPKQDAVKKQIEASLNHYETFLLHGVTGSGKTEIYIKLIDTIIKNDKTAIVLVPEISLTTQISKRFYETFGSDVAILHSSLSEGEKYDEYIKIANGLVHVVVGTRSAIFAPLKNLGIIIIDEEDAQSYKQDNNPRYHARNIANFRAEYNHIPLVLASATPSLESKARADKHVYTLLTLNERVGKSILPKITVVNMEEEMKKRNMIFSDLLALKINEKLEKQEQIILLLNRRGFSTYITCSNCGYTYKCPNCDITLTFHKTSNSLTCHYCGYKTKKEDRCPECNEESLNYYGLGTEKLEENIKLKFPSARVLRMDQDTTRNKGAHEKIIEKFKNHEFDILLGTQMISKGLDFPLVTLVGIINADSSLNIPNFRSSENTFSLLCQVAGRSGRSDKNGEVIIQTFNPDNYVINCVKENNYNKFYLYEMNFRKKLKYPPYFYLVSLKVIGTNYETTIENSKKVKKYLDNNLSNEFIILGPTMANVFKFNNEYRMQIIIKYKKEDNLLKVLRELDNIFIMNKDTRLEIDFEPLNI